MASEKAKQGGKKKGGKAPAKGAPEEKKSGPENVAIFVALEYPEWKKQTLEVLSDFQFDKDNKIVGNYI